MLEQENTSIVQLSFPKAIEMKGRARKFIAGTSCALLLGVWGSIPGAGAATLNDISGEYYFGDGLGMNCTLKVYPNGRFSFLWTGCLGTYDKTQGKAILENDVLHLSPGTPTVQKGVRGSRTNFFAIPWQGRMYLVHDIVEFCSDINQGQEPRDSRRGFYYLRTNDWEKPVTGTPQVPEAFSKYLLDKPVKGKISELLNEREAWVNLGSERGILPGMTLTARDQGAGFFTQLRVDAVEASRCRVTCKYRDPKLAVNQAVSSRFHD